jgi:hypothetical protein
MYIYNILQNEIYWIIQLRDTLSEDMIDFPTGQPESTPTFQSVKLIHVTMAAENATKHSVSNSIKNEPHSVKFIVSSSSPMYL